MSSALSPQDAAFFVERDAHKAPGVTRSLARARAFAGHLGIDLDGIAKHAWPVIAVVGSKGKGTAATYAAATLSAAGIRVGLLTSPGYRTSRERIRVDGTAISAPDYARLAARIDETRRRVAAELPEGGYLSPTGLYTLAAVRHFLDAGCEAVVLEAGMGGGSDEISLFPARVVAVTSIFGEHIPALGDSIEGVAANKLGIIGPATVAVCAVAQTHPGLDRQIREASKNRRLLMVAGGDVELAPDWPRGLIGMNARLGVVAAVELLKEMNVGKAEAPAREAVWRTVSLPGRLSVHTREQQTWGLDAAINATGARAAREWFEREGGKPHTVVVCLADDKDRDGVLGELAGLRVVEVRVDAPHLDFSNQQHLPKFRDLNTAELGKRVLALGTISFAGEVLDMFNVDIERAFLPLRAALTAKAAR